MIASFRRDFESVDAVLVARPRRAYRMSNQTPAFRSAIDMQIIVHYIAG
jgi:hypothetical protein